MRRLSKALDAAPMSLYRHFAAKDDLLDAIVDRLIAQVSQPPEAAGWEERLRMQMRGYRGLAHASPHMFPLLGRRRMRVVSEPEPRELQPAEWLLDDLVGAGFGLDDAVHALRTVLSFTYGYALSEIHGFSLEGVGDGPGRYDIRSVDPTRFPRLSEVAPRLATWDHDAEFERGLDFIIAGLRSSLPRS